MKRSTVFLFFLIFLLINSIVSANTSEITNGLSYLTTIQNPDGSWGNVSSSTEVLPSTVSVIKTMNELNDTSSQNYSNAVSWLQSQSLDTTDYLSERIQALSLAGTDQYAILSYLDNIYTDAWGGYGDYESNILDTALALTALNKLNYSDLDAIGYSLSYLLDNQNVDGGFGLYPGDDSNTFISTVVLKLFALYSEIFYLQDEVNNAVTYLLTKQNPDGGFGSSPSTVYETALAYDALISSGTDTSTAAQPAIDYLLANQLANGSWDDDPYSTALALRALANVKPNLIISPSDIVFSASVPTVGDTITITATIQNDSLTQADNVTVQFYNGNPDTGGALIGEETILTIAHYGSSQSIINWTVQQAGTHAIYVMVDPANAIEELEETDNIASSTITSASLADLSISSADISFSPAVPLPDDPMTIKVNLRNKGETAANNVSVTIYNGDPASGGTNIGSASIASINPGGSASTQFAATFAAGTHYIFAVIDEANVIDEGSEANNIAMRALQVGVTGGDDIDLSINSEAIILNPAYPIEGNIVTIAAHFQNQGTVDATDVLVRFYLGDPDAGGTQIGSDIVVPSIAAGGSESANTTWNTAGLAGTNEIYVKIDPVDVITELSELNNTAFLAVRVAGTSGTNLMVSYGEISFSPPSPASGEIVTISALIRNNSYTVANNVLVEFSDGDPRIGGTRIIGSQLIPTISASIYDNTVAQVTMDTTELSGAHEIYVNVDPFNEIIETDEKDNIAHTTLVIEPPTGPDIEVSAIDTTNIITDTQSNQVSGTVTVTIENKGNQDIIDPFDVTIFEDRDGNDSLDPNTDNIIGQITHDSILSAGVIVPLDISLSGVLLFRDNALYVFVDSTDVVLELDETNNLWNTAQQCEADPPVCDKYDVVEKFAWTGVGLPPSWRGEYNSPVVANLSDDNADGLINELDIPDIIFHAVGRLTAISGDDGHELFSITNPDYLIWTYSHIAVGDIDNDGIVEILGFSNRFGPRIVAFENDGTFKWQSDPIYIPTGTIYRWSVSVADIDNDGSIEIISGPNVLNSDGTLRWSVASNDGLSVIADLDLDGFPEILIGKSAYRNDGTLYWTNTDIVQSNLAHAVADLDDDPYPEIVQVMQYAQFDVWVYLLEHDGTLKWGPIEMSSGGFIAVPSIGDFDGDGSPEIGVSARDRYTVLAPDGTIKWQNVVHDGTYGGVSASVFDFDGDGASEIIHNDMQYLRIFNGKNGVVLYSTPNSTATFYDATIVADIDNDQSAEIVVNANWGYTYTYKGFRVFENACDDWSDTRNIWNEYNYHITNINDDGTIPQVEQNNWDIYNNFRENLLIPKEPDGTPDITSSLITVDQSNYPASVTISARIGNGGAVGLPAGADISIYDGDPLQGGILIGTAVTASELEKGMYEDVSIVWNSPTAGSRIIHVIADEGNLIAECREDNNTAFASFDIGSGPDIPRPDLSINTGDIVVNPSLVIEGQPASVSATIHNTGALSVSDIDIAFYDGDPRNGGTLIQTVTHPLIDTGMSATVEVPWDTLGQSGVNFIYVLADPDNVIDESNENNNESLIQVDVSPPTKPDLVITTNDIAFSSQSPIEGDPLTLTATIHNFGSDTSNVKADLYDGDPLSGGTLLDFYNSAPIISFGGQAQVVFTIDTVGKAGNHSYYVLVDPDNTIDEQNESNNSASADVTINSIGLDLAAATDKAQYAENEDVLTTVTLSDLLNQIRDISVDVQIVDSAGSLVVTVPAQPVMLNPLGTQTVSFTWNTGNTLIGDYLVTATAYDSASIPRARQSVQISIMSSQGIVTTIVFDQNSYDPNETAQITTTVSNNSVNQIFENITTTVTITDQTSQVLFTEETALSAIAPLSLESLNSFWNISANPPGDYSVTAEVRDASGILISSSVETLTINSTQDPSQLLIGEISVDIQSLLQGDPVAITYSVTNVGNVDLATVDLSILTVHVVELTAYDTLTDQTALLMGETYTNTQQLDTQTYTAKDYLVILRASISGSEATLASTYFRVEGAPSAPSLNSPAQDSDVETLTPVLEVNNASDPNDDDLTYEFELYSDNTLTNLVASSGVISEGINTTSWQVPADLVENEWYYWRARAYDGMLYGDWMIPSSFRVNVVNDAPTAPTLSSPADNSEVDSFTPVLTVNNASDPDSANLTYNFEVSLDVNFAQIVASEIGIFEGDGTTSWQVNVNLTENTYYYWRTQADDWLDVGPWMTPAVFFVNTTNDAPSAPGIIAPSDGSEVASLSVDIVISNSTDPESDPLTYAFELDTVNTFDSPNLVSASGITEGAGTTTWNIANLTDNTWYFVRSKASDGLADSSWSAVTTFFVNTVNDPPTVPVLANPSDGSGVNVFTPELSVINSTDVDEDALFYEFEVFDDPGMLNLVASSSLIPELPQITSWTVSISLVENQTYYWRARAFDGELYSGWMSLASFMVNTANDAPTAPALDAPSDGSSLDTLNPTLSIYNSTDPENDTLTYRFEIYENGVPVQTITDVAEDSTGITSITLTDPLTDNTTYGWRASAYDGDRYGPWMNMATFSVHLPIVSINATIDFDPNTLNKKSKGKWVVVYIELPDGYDVNDIIISSILLGGTVPAESWPYAVGDEDNDGIPDLMVKFSRDDVKNLLPTGDEIMVHVTGEVGTVEFEGVDTIRVTN